MVVCRENLNLWGFVETFQNQIKCRLGNSGEQMQLLLLEALREGKSYCLGNKQEDTGPLSK